MNFLPFDFKRILKFAEKMKVPISKKRGIIREYLQVRFIEEFYRWPQSKKMVFAGGTSMRLLRDLDRFSEDLDFDNLGLRNEEIVQLVSKTVERYRQENIELELKINKRKMKTFFELRFPKLLYQLKITTNPREKLAIKVDYSDLWKGQRPEAMLLNRYGHINTVLTNSIDQLLVQKITAYIRRKEIQPRDIYDAVWLFSQGAGIDVEFAQANGLPDLVKKAREKYQKEGIAQNLFFRLKPFLFEERSIEKMNLFGDVLKELGFSD